MVTWTNNIHRRHKTRSPAISITSLMQYFGRSLNKISKFRRHENAINSRRRVFGFDDAMLIEPASDETEIMKNCHHFISHLYKKFSIFLWNWPFSNRRIKLLLSSLFHNCLTHINGSLLIWTLLISENLHLVHFDERKSMLSVDKSSIFNSLIRSKFTLLNVSNCAALRLAFKLSLFM